MSDEKATAPDPLTTLTPKMVAKIRSAAADPLQQLRTPKACRDTVAFCDAVDELRSARAQIERLTAAMEAPIAEVWGEYVKVAGVPLLPRFGYPTADECATVNAAYLADRRERMKPTKP